MLPLPAPPRHRALIRALASAAAFRLAILLGALVTVLTLASLATTAEPTTWGAGLLAFVALAAVASWSAARSPRAGAPEPTEATTTSLAIASAPWLAAPWRWLAAVPLLRAALAPRMRLEASQLVLESRWGARTTSLKRITDVTSDLTGITLHEFDATTTRIATVTLPVVGAQGTTSAAVKHAQFAAAIAMLAFNERLAQAILAQRDRLPSAYRCRPARARVAASPSLEQVEPPPSMSESRARTL